MLKHFAAVAAIAMTSTAAHAVTFVVSPLGTPIPQDARTITFDGANPRLENGIRAVGGQIFDSSVPNVARDVNGSAFLGTHAFDAGTGSASIYSTVGGFRTLSFDWGSPDSHNRLALLDESGATIQAFNGSDLGFGSGTDQEARRVAFTIGENDASIFGVRFFSSRPAFEVDNVSFSSAVPEPATWAMMIGGFGLVGSVMRRRNQVPAVIA